MERILSINFCGQDYWLPKTESIIFVKDDNDKEKLFELLCEQDSDWVGFKDIIRIVPKEVTIGYLESYALPCWKCIINDIEGLKKQVDFIIYQKHN